MKKEIRVAVGVVYRQRNTEVEILIAKRHQNQHQGGLWEFPGGKIEQGESCLGALKRELLEEVNIVIHNAEPLTIIKHDYGDKQVSLETMISDNYEGIAEGLEGQIVKWVHIAELNNYAFPDANRAIISTLFNKIACR